MSSDDVPIRLLPNTVVALLPPVNEWQLLDIQQHQRQYSLAAKTGQVHQCPLISFGNCARSCSFFRVKMSLPERTFAARRTVIGMSQGETKSSAVISGDGMLKWKRIGSEVANLVYERLEAPGCLIRRM